MPDRDPTTGKFVATASGDPRLPSPDQFQAPPPLEPPPKPLETPPAGEDTKVKAKTKEVDTSGMRALAESFLGTDKTKVDEEKTDEQKTEETRVAEETKKKVEAKAKVTPAAKVVPKPTPQPQHTPLSAEEVARAAAEGVARAMGEKAGDKKPVTPEAPKLPENEQRKVSILKTMETLYPEKYKGIADKYASSVVKLQEYAKKWEMDHPGEEFDPDAEEHTKFFDENDVDWMDEDYQESIAEIRAEKKIAELRKQPDPQNQRLTQLEKAEKLREATPSIYAEQTTAAKQFWNSLGDDLKDVVKADGTVDTKILDGLQKQDGNTWATYVETATSLELEVAELYKLYEGLVEPMPEYKGGDQKLQTTSMIHRNMINFALSQEDKLLKSEPADRLDAQGRSFLSAAEYYKLPADKRATHWTFGFKDLAALRAAELASLAKNAVQKRDAEFRKWAEAKGIKVPAQTQNGGQELEKKEDEAPLEDDGKPLSPSSASPSKLAATRDKEKAEAKTPAEAFVLRAF